MFGVPCQENDGYQRLGASYDGSLERSDKAKLASKTRLRYKTKTLWRIPQGFSIALQKESQYAGRHNVPLDYVSSVDFQYHGYVANHLT